ncbi:MAG: hypothetical protein KGJ36_05445 [Acidobacteriota bacterium]|nr:hypothetical protein [Acidobacteriota bacterium]
MDNVTCTRCQSPTESLGTVSIVTGGSSSAAKFFLGQLAEMGERNWALAAFRCTSCRHVEFFDAAG